MKQDFLYYKNKLCVTSQWLYSNVISFYSYNYHVKKGNFKVIRRGGGADNPTLIEYESIKPLKYKYLIQDVLGVDPYKYVIKSEFAAGIIPDPKAHTFFADALKFDKNADKKLPVLIADAEVLNACLRQYNNRRAFRRKLAGTTNNIWQSISKEVNALNKKEFPHNLPKSESALRKKAKLYKDNSYGVLLHANRGNKSAQKRNEKLEYLIINLFVMPTKPYAEEVHKMYLKFLAGKLAVVDRVTGEMFDHTDKAFIEVSPATIWNIVNAPKYAALIVKLRDGDYTYTQTQRPYHHRSKSIYSLSKISLDDRDIMHTKTNDSIAVKAYYAFDTLSGAIIGYAHNKKKIAPLFRDMLINMFGFLRQNSLGVPMEAEVEHHLVKEFENTAMTIFPRVRWANPTNSQEKWSERGIGLKKYGVEKNANIGVGRHYAKYGPNRITEQKIFDEENNRYVERKASYKQIVAQDIAEINQYNNELHPNQKKYPGKTRMQILMDNVNPELPKLPESLIAKYLGIPVITSIRRNHYIKALNSEFRLEKFAILDKLAPNNYNVTAYYLADEKSDVNRLFLFQNGTYLGDAVPTDTYNTAREEWNDADAENYTNQASYVAKFDKLIKDKKEKAAKVVVIPNEPKQYEVDTQIVETIPETDDNIWQPSASNYDYAAAAVNDL